MGQRIKRFFDIIISFSGLILFLPVMMVIYIISFIHLGRPVFFTQIRPGLYEKPFKLIKFRTMKNLVNEKGKLLSDEHRLVTWGKLLRNTSLDELPTLINVFLGDMSLVGPRPLLTEYLPLYNKKQKRRHLLKPGMTGWAQVNGRNDVNWDEKLKMDVWYVENQSLTLDFKIIMKTFYITIFRKGIQKTGFATTDKFEGTRGL